ncbi:uncharacterized protein LOC120536183 [Polypterus senegalus]|uniref:uncharacterized protein LOC120536183 n=1 Tax=Polypterus senegalus TaxID=55291 RepID=UPI00196529F8|nr:uncharacterized protein LOC120536183 [Polypterus senegalus]
MMHSLRGTVFSFLVIFSICMAVKISTPPQEVTATFKSDVLLPSFFKLSSPQYGLKYTTAKWTRAKDKSKLSELIYKNVTNYSRANMSESELKKGNASLSLSMVTFEDEGEYLFEIEEAAEIPQSLIIVLKIIEKVEKLFSEAVTEGANKMITDPISVTTQGPTVGKVMVIVGPTLAALGVLAALVCLYVKRRLFLKSCIAYRNNCCNDPENQEANNSRPENIPLQQVL